MVETQEKPDVQEGENGSAVTVQGGALAVLARAEVDIQISTAHAYPRSIAQFKRDAMSMATIDLETASSMFYSLPRGGKTIEGPSVRLAEIVGSAWGNLRYGSRIVAEDRNFVTAQGVCHDLQKNVSSTVEIRRRITNKQGVRFNDDMIIVTCNAACSIALRNALFRVVPMCYIKEVYDAAKKVAIGDAKTLVNRRAQAVEFFQKMGVGLDRILGVLGKPSIEDVDLSDLSTLTGLRNAVKDGDTSVDDAFPPVQQQKSGPAANGNGKTKDLERRLESALPAATTAPTPPEPAEAKPAHAEAKPTPTETTPPPMAEGEIPNETPKQPEPAPPAVETMKDIAKASDANTIFLDIGDHIREANSMANLDAAGSALKKQRKLLGEEKYQHLLAKWRARAKELDPEAKGSK